MERLDANQALEILPDESIHTVGTSPPFWSLRDCNVEAHFMKETERKCVYVVGAGFSAGLGYPLTGDLLLRLWDRIKNDQPFKKELQEVISFHHPRFDIRKFSSFPNVEELLSQMMVNSQLFDSSRRHAGKFTKEFLEELQRTLLLKISDWFHEISEGLGPKKSFVPWLKKFRDRIRRENAVIISFNWDLILDELLFGDDLGAKSYGFSADPFVGPVLLKPHGSLNWFESNPGRFLLDSRKILLYGDDENTHVYAFRKFRAPVSKKNLITHKFQSKLAAG